MSCSIELLDRLSVPHPGASVSCIGARVMIRGVIIVNNHGKPRLVKFYQTVVSLCLPLVLFL